MQNSWLPFICLDIEYAVNYTSQFLNSWDQKQIMSEGEKHVDREAVLYSRYISSRLKFTICWSSTKHHCAGNSGF